MQSIQQMSLPFEAPHQEVSSGKLLYSGRDLGTFKDSLRAPIYRWFKYPAGYSYKFVQQSMDIFGVEKGDWMYDPFSGTGTTLLAAQQMGINGYGVEAHPFVHWVAQVKLYRGFDVATLRPLSETFLHDLQGYILQIKDQMLPEAAFPELIYKCYHAEDLRVLYFIREYIQNQAYETPFIDFLKLALTDTLRRASIAGTGWPYIAPPKNALQHAPKNALEVFQKTLRGMYQDLVHQTIPATAQIINHLGDSRESQDMAEGQVKLALTSPPYLNNYDYADRTRLEMYFWGLAKSWGEITKQVRDKLIVAATTQVTRSHYTLETALDSQIATLAPLTYTAIQAAVLELGQRRLQKGGKKDYDLMTALYFNDMLQVIQETYRVLETGGHFCLVLGDSAPYGVHLPTEKWIGELALGIGFRHYEYSPLRSRGDKWRDNPQRHKVALQEGILILEK